ncbi:MAG: crossover junction endodeoxyribonuclease RuvC [Clostridia bacterium]|nr:crossover junction endodeoxyribonuclease RuvC [Clostridia bacterium]
MRILGIDPGYAIIGHGIIEYKNTKYIYINHGAITTNSNENFTDRLEKIYDNITNLVNIYKPDQVSIEKLYFQNNQKTAIDVAQARGVIILALKKYNIPVYEYTPLQVKNMITGYGKAQKKQIMLTVQRLLRLEEIPKPDDAADALAIAICHANSMGFNYINNKILKIRSANKIVI